VILYTGFRERAVKGEKCWSWSFFDAQSFLDVHRERFVLPKGWVRLRRPDVHSWIIEVQRTQELPLWGRREGRHAWMQSKSSWVSQSPKAITQISLSPPVQAFSTKPEEEGNGKDSQNMMIILCVFGVMLGILSVVFFVNCMRKIIRDHKIIRVSWIEKHAKQPSAEQTKTFSICLIYQPFDSFAEEEAKAISL
jgi:hypothetical protein